MALESQYEFLSNAHTDPLGYFLDHPGVEKLRLALLDVQAQEAALDGRLGENHPRMIELKRLETELAHQIRAEIGRDVASVHARYDAASARETRIRERLKRQQETDTQLARLGTRYQLLKNDVETARGLHTSLLQQQMATAANANLESTNLTVVERADVPRWPSRPKIPLTLALGVAAGLVFGLGAAFTRDYFDHSLKSSEDVETQLQLPALATIPNFALARRMSGAPLEPRRPGANGSSHTPELIVHHEPDSYVAEAFRTVRTTLLLPTSGDAPHVIVVTSARAGEGKTIASLNLATALVQSGARVVLVEADLRHPRCHRALRLPTGPGLSQHLADAESELDRLVQVIEPPGISFLPAGRLPWNPTELLGSPRMADVIATLRARYEFVIVDTPPAGPVSDAALIARHADGVLLVVKGGATPREVVRRTRDRLVHTGARFLGVIVNDVRLEWENGYGYSYGYGPHHGDRGGFVHAITGIVRGERAV
jgi:capsular exopolysaccharide synthesis family protein